MTHLDTYSLTLLLTHSLTQLFTHPFSYFGSVFCLSVKKINKEIQLMFKTRQILIKLNLPKDNVLSESFILGKNLFSTKL